MGVNNLWADVAGKSRESFIGMDMESLISPESLRDVISLLKKRKIGEGTFASIPFLLRTEPGQDRSLRMSIFPLSEPSGASTLVQKRFLK
jgi:hypothetical protein